MTVLRLADAGEAADLAAFLARLIHYDRRAAVRLQAGAGTPPAAGGVVAVFGRPASFEVLAIRTARLAEPCSVDATVSAGQLADALDAAAAAGASRGGLVVTVPEAVTGPPWAGVLPPRGGWLRVEGLPGAEDVRAVVAAAVAEFRKRTAALPEDGRTRAELDRIGREIWSRTLGSTGLPLRAAHAAQALGFLRPTGAVPAARGGSGAAGGAARSAGSPPGGTGSPSGGAGSAAVGGVRTAPADPAPQPTALLAAGSWLRLRTPYGSIAVRRAGLPGLAVTPS